MGRIYEVLLFSICFRVMPPSSWFILLWTTFPSWDYPGVTERWVGRKGGMGRRSYGHWQKKVELFDVEKGQILFMRDRDFCSQVTSGCHGGGIGLCEVSDSRASTNWVRKGRRISGSQISAEHKENLLNMRAAQRCCEQPGPVWLSG